MSRNRLDGAFAFVTFGDLLTQHGELKAGEIFRQLFAAGIWYIPRPSKVLKAGSKVLFYQSAVGFIATAEIADVAPAPPRWILDSVPASSFAQQLRLVSAETFGEPVSVQPIVDQLDFVLNKKYWGTALRGTPRAIARSDYEMILKYGRKTRTSTSKGMK